MQLVKKDLKAKYKSTFLGYFWSIGNPLLMAYILNFAFGHILKIKQENYIVFIITALFAWNWFNIGVMGTINCFINNASIIKKVNLPRYLIPLSSTLTEAFHFLLSIPIILFFLFINNMPIFHLSWIYGIPLLMIITQILTFGIALAASSINTIIRDMERVVGLLMTVLFYLTPIIYPARNIPIEFKIIFDLNPLAILIDSWRELLMNGSINWNNYLISIVGCLIMLCISSCVYLKLSNKFAEVL